MISISISASVVWGLSTYISVAFWKCISASSTTCTCLLATSFCSYINHHVNKCSVHMEYVTRLGQLKFYATSDVGTQKQGFKGEEANCFIPKVHTKCNRTYSYIEMPYFLTLCSQSSKLLFWNSHESHSYRSQPEQSESTQIQNYCGGASSMFTD